MSNLIIVDDDIHFVRSVFNYIQSVQSNIHVINISVNGEEAVQSICSFQPDILMLDLKMPQKSGIQVLNELKMQNSPMPQIIINSGYPDLLSQINLKDFPISYIFFKPVQLENLVNKLMSLDEEISISKLESAIHKDLECFTFNHSSAGFLYLTKAILLCLKDNSLFHQMEKNLFSKVAKYFPGASDLQVKWTINKTLKAMIRYTPKSILTEYFPHHDYPTPKLFIKTMVDRQEKAREYH